MKFFYTICTYIFISQIGWSQQEGKDTLQKTVPIVLQNLIHQLTDQKNAPKTADAIDPNDLEIDGIVIDETISKSGREFYELFYKHWNTLTGYSGFSAIVVEKPYRLNNTLIEVTLDDNLVYQAMVQRRYDLIEEMAQQAISYVTTHMEQLQNTQKALEEGDLSGNGI